MVPILLSSIGPHLLPTLFSFTCHCVPLQLGVNWNQFLEADSTPPASFSFGSQLLFFQWNLSLPAVISDLFLVRTTQLKQIKVKGLLAVFLQLNYKSKDFDYEVLSFSNSSAVAGQCWYMVSPQKTLPDCWSGLPMWLYRYRDYTKWCVYQLWVSTSCTLKMTNPVSGVRGLPSARHM